MHGEVRSLSIAEIALLAVALGSDAFSVAVCVGLAGANSIERIRLATGFGSFQLLMPVVGLYIGRLFSQISIFGREVDQFAGYVGGGMLILLGLFIIVRTIRDGVHCPKFIHKSLVALIAASIGVSIDALAVGFSLGILGTKLLLTVIIMGAVAFIMTIVGLEVGNQAGKYVQNWAAVLGGMILIGIGTRLLFVA